MKVTNKDATMTALRAKLRECEEKGQEQLAVITRCVMQIIGDMPEVDVNDGVACEQCFFYNAETRRCIHKNGLNGRIRKGMYCSYGSLNYDASAEAGEEPDEDWSEFDEG